MFFRFRSTEVRQPVRHQWNDQIGEAQVQLLYGNAGTGVTVTIVAAPVLAYFESRVVENSIVLVWLLYMLFVSGARFVLARRYSDATPKRTHTNRWAALFAAGAGLAGTGWGCAGILLYAETHLINQVFLIFVIGGMMLGGASLLAPRREAFLAFLIPAGILPAIRLMYEGDQEHIVMGLLAVLFTAAVLASTSQWYRTILSSLNLQFENQALLQDVQLANERTQCLNEQLELRVEKRTAELQETTMRLQAEIEQREQAEEELLRVRTLESLGVLAGGIAHDFNNFLTVVQGNIDLAKLHLEPGAPVREILDRTVSACQSAVFLSSQLLTFAKGGAPVRRVVSVAKVILDAVQLAQAGAPGSIVVDVAGDLWPAEVDTGQIGQVLHNILLNAREAMLGDGITEVHAENVGLINDDDKEPRSAACVRISIRDYGAGIAPEVLPRIFDPYFTTKPGGNGLGLAVAHAIVSKHSGHILVNSKLGEGTVFIIDLPASKQLLRSDVALPPRVHRGKGRLLVMEDEESLRILLERVLTTLGYEVQSARDGAEAIALYEAAKASSRGFDAVLLDLTVRGGMGGVEAASKLKEIDPSARLIVSSGYSQAPVMSRFREYGFCDVIQKPWVTADLSEVFRRVLVGQPERKAH